MKCPELANFLETETRLVPARTENIGRKLEMAPSGYKVYFCGDKNILTLIVVTIPKFCAYAEIHWLVHFKQADRSTIFEG